tara:strand:+ start:90 stop:887 length:798 start_codon:yes stop_codon:yes gene_type:complete
MKKSKPSQKKIEIMCINNDCSAFLSPTELPSELSLDEISHYKCPRCKGFMRKHSNNIAKNLRSRENKRLVNDPYSILGTFIGIPLIFYVWRSYDTTIIEYGFNIFTGLLLVGLICSVFFLIFKYFDKKKSTFNTKSFHSLNKYYHDGNFFRIVKQGLITFPILYFIKIRADQLAIFDLSSALEEAELSYGLVFVPFLICYFLIKTEFMNTNYDYKGDEFVDKASAVQRMGILYGIWYGIFGWILAFLIDWFIVGLRIVYIVIMDL